MNHTRRIIYRHLKDRIYFSEKRVLLSGILNLTIAAVSVISPYLYKMLVDDVMSAGDIELLFVVIPAMIGTYLVKQVFTGIQIYLNKSFSYGLLLETKKCLMQKILARSISSDFRKDCGTLSNVLERDCGAVYTFLASHVVGFVTSCMIAGTYTVLMLNINVWLGLFSIILLPLSIWFSRKIGKKFNAVNKECYEISSKTKIHLFDTVQKWREIKTNTLEQWFSSEYDRRLEPERQLNSRWMFYFALRDLVYVIKRHFVLKVLAYFVGGLFVISKDISVGELLLLISFMESVESALDTIMKSQTDFLGQRAVFERLFEILDELEPIKGKKYPENKTIYLKEVDFAYDGTDDKVLEKASCEFEGGKKYLLVGKSGEGKSTLIKLLLNMNHQQKGDLLVGSVAVSDIDSHSLLKNVGAVMQENVFFNLSIRENMELIAPEATEADLIAALKSACLYEFVEELPQKIDTVIGERGVKLSGGQKQRLAIARLILYAPQVVILDEATSALDSVVERRILDNLSAVFRDKTMIVISHKPLVNYVKDQTYLIRDRQIIPIA